MEKAIITVIAVLAGCWIIFGFARKLKSGACGCRCDGCGCRGSCKTKKKHAADDKHLEMK